MLTRKAFSIAATAAVFLLTASHHVAVAGQGIIVSCTPNVGGTLTCHVCEPGAGIASIVVHSVTIPVVIELERQFKKCICANCTKREANCDFTLDKDHDHLVWVEQWRARQVGPMHVFMVDKNGRSERIR
jgi:hypothetical protein